MPPDMDPAEAEQRREEYRRAVADRMMTMRINHEKDRRRVRSWVRNLPAESRRQAILARLNDPDIHRKGNAGTRKALRAELERLPAS